MDIINQAATKKRIKELRLKNGYTQEQIAKMMNGSRSYYNSMETGDRVLTERYLNTLSAVYYIDVEEIVIYEQSEYNKLEETMNSINSYRPANYYFLRNGNLADDLKDLVKYMGSEKITEYNLLDPILTHLGYEVKLIDIQKYIQRWTTEKENSKNCKIRQNAIELLDYFENQNVAVLIENKNNSKDKILISIDKYNTLENHLHNSIIGNLNNLEQKYSSSYKSNQCFF